jgi:hypothetical protein
MRYAMLIYGNEAASTASLATFEQIPRSILPPVTGM